MLVKLSSKKKSKLFQYTYIINDYANGKNTRDQFMLLYKNTPSFVGSEPL